VHKFGLYLSKKTDARVLAIFDRHSH